MPEVGLAALQVWGGPWDGHPGGSCLPCGGLGLGAGVLGGFQYFFPVCIEQ